jgi:hypothetical protein
MRAYVNERPVEVADGATVGDAVRAADPVLADLLLDASAHATDGRGIPLAAAQVLRPGSIVRVVVSARRSANGAESTDADA